MEEVKTGVDELMELVGKEGRISIPDVAKKLKQPEQTIQNWVDFLVEEKLLGIEYKFTTPYIYVNSPEKANVIATKQETVELHKKDFIDRAQQKGMPQDKLAALWQNHLREAIERKHDFFMQECQKRNFPNTEELFKRYKEKLLT